MYSNKRIIQFFKYQAILTLIVIMTGSCKKFLEEVPTGNMTDQTNFASAEEGAALIIGPYRSLAQWTKGADDWGNYLPATLEYPTGKAYT